MTAGLNITTFPAVTESVIANGVPISFCVLRIANLTKNPAAQILCQKGVKSQAFLHLLKQMRRRIRP